MQPLLTLISSPEIEMALTAIFAAKLYEPNIGNNLHKVAIEPTATFANPSTLISRSNP